VLYSDWKSHKFVVVNQVVEIFFSEINTNVIVILTR
jgi:hypothetical protein